MSINRELTLARLPTLTQPIYCTMKGYRSLGIGGSASLNAVCSQIKLARSGETHGAMEDAWLSMQIYLWLHDCPHQARLPELYLWHSVQLSQPGRPPALCLSTNAELGGRD